MKKRTNEEKKQMIDEACDMFNEAAELIKKGKRLFYLCGIEFCGGFHEESCRKTDPYSNNLHIYTGIKKLCNLVGKKSSHPQNPFNRKSDKSYLKIRYKNLKFIQLGEEVTSTQGKFTFK